jgi:hypothetical protein
MRVVALIGLTILVFTDMLTMCWCNKRVVKNYFISFSAIFYKITGKNCNQSNS